MAEMRNKQRFLPFGLRLDEGLPATEQGIGIGGDDPGSAGHDAGTVIGEQLFQGRIGGPLRPRQPAGRGHATRSRNWSRHAIQGELVQAANFSSRRPLGKEWYKTVAGVLGSDFAERDTSTMQTGCWTPEDPRVDFGLMSFRGAIDDPDRVGGATEIIPHLLKTRPVQETRNGDETDDSGVGLGVVVEDLPGRPPPEEDVQVAKTLRVPRRPIRGAASRREWGAGRWRNGRPRSSRRDPWPFPCTADCRSPP